MGTLIMRYRFAQTKPKELTVLRDELRLADVPHYYRERFNVKKIEFWSEHFESFDKDYLLHIHDQIKAAGCHLLDVQLDSAPFMKPYNLAALNEEERQESLKTVKRWMDATALLGSECVRVNPGRKDGSVKNSIASLKEVKRYADEKNLKIITANHFGLEMDPALHVRVVKETGGIYTEPDFGNYPHNDHLYDSLAKILPYAYIVSAKVDEFNADMEHISYDFDRCVQLAESLGFKGMYMVAQWSPKFQDIDYAKVADWVIAHIKQHIHG
jgi:sugar phosphate isomerase/epimerase